MKWKPPSIRMLERVACALCLTSAALAQASDSHEVPDPEAWEVQSVRELMQHDIERSLEQTRQRAGPPAAVGASSGRPAPRLIALYGVGRTLMAEVLIGTHAYLYMRGQPHPLGYANDPLVYQLRGMEGSCIELQKAQTSHSLCLHATLGARRP